MKIENVIKKFNNKMTYKCPICNSDMLIEEKSMVCSKKHSYDFSKKGYIHLINNYKATKYSEQLFVSRNYVFNNSFYDHIINKIYSIVVNYKNNNVLDVGCGEGFYIKELKKKIKDSFFFGLDNSKDAIEIAVREDKENPYLLANLANLPFSDNSIDVVLNILTPANYQEFFRILTESGTIIKVVPTVNYLKEIRELINKSDYSNEDTINLLENYGEIVSREVVSKTFSLKPEAAKHFLQMTPLTFSQQITEELINKLKEITIELEIIVAKAKTL